MALFAVSVNKDESSLRLKRISDIFVPLPMSRNDSTSNFYYKCNLAFCFFIQQLQNFNLFSNVMVICWCNLPEHAGSIYMVFMDLVM